MNTFIILFQFGGGLFNFLPIVLMVGIFYFLVILPNKKQKEQMKEMIAALKIGDEIVTNGGIIGKIIEVRASSFIIRSAEKSMIEIGKVAVVGTRAEEEVIK